jgi:ATP-dependent Lon protease
VREDKRVHQFQIADLRVFLAGKMKQISPSAGDEEKNLTAEHAETAEILLPKGKNTNRFMKIPSSLRPPGSLRVLVFC